ncbi:lipopolysaccharide transport periplasmic protein LptA [Limnohabitans sp. Rim8]|uniref:lipopolysaccharide transport periplasmic protein LptA n=1 Tax=Limnohabitans sp. Rim8 TaxID=1100718 RepID=UPI003306732F
MKFPLALTSLALAAFLAAPTATAEKADSKQPMHIEADALKHDESAQITTFTGRVMVTKGTLVLRSEKLEVQQNKEGKQVAKLWAAKGELAFFRQKREGLDEFTEGEAETVIYDSQADKITLTGRAELRSYRGQQLSDRLQGHLIVFDNTTEVFTVDGKAPTGSSPSGSQRIKATLTPRNTAKDDSKDNSLVPLLQSSPRLTGGKP